MPGGLAHLYDRLVQRLLGLRLLPRFRFLRRIHRSLISAMVPESVQVDGHIIYLDPVDSLHLSENGVYESLETSLLREHVKPGNTVLDIGANIGYHTLLMARLVGNEGKVIALEPDAGNCRLLEKNIRANGYGNVQVMQKAVAGSPGRATLYRSLRSGAQHNIGGGEGEPVEVETVTLDELLEACSGRVDLVKMDIEGAEMLALRGGSALLSQPGLQLMIEYNPLALDRFGERPADLPLLLREYGFTLYDIDRRADSVKAVSPDYIAERYSVANMRNTNLYCVKEEGAHRVQATG